MKSKLKFLLAVFFGVALFFISSEKSFAQNDKEEGGGKVDPNKKVFWFMVTVQAEADKETKQDIFTMRCPGSIKDKIKSGTKDSYDQALWRILSKSAKTLLIGPFVTYQEARESALIYSVAKGVTAPDSILNSGDKTYYWFRLDFEQANRGSKTYSLKRTPARVESGSKKDFDDNLMALLLEKTLLVGPFTNQPDAEESKRLYRLHEK